MKYKKGDVVRVIREPKFRQKYISNNGLGHVQTVSESITGLTLVVVSFSEKNNRWLLRSPRAMFSDTETYQCYDDEIELVTE